MLNWVLSTCLLSVPAAVEAKCFGRGINNDDGDGFYSGGRGKVLATSKADVAAASCKGYRQVGAEDKHASLSLQPLTKLAYDDRPVRTPSSRPVSRQLALIRRPR
jgi:hypothetical protein